MWQNKLFCSQCLEEKLLNSCCLSLYRADLIHLCCVLEVFRVEKMFDHTLCSPARPAQAPAGFVLGSSLHRAHLQILNQGSDISLGSWLRLRAHPGLCPGLFPHAVVPEVTSLSSLPALGAGPSIPGPLQCHLGLPSGPSSAAALQGNAHIPTKMPFPRIWCQHR